MTIFLEFEERCLLILIIDEKNLQDTQLQKRL